MFTRCLALACLAMLHFAQSAVAGAWPREDGAGFLQFQLRDPTEGGGAIASAYLEYGLTDRLTLGGKLELDTEAGSLSSAMLFGRWHFPADGFPLQTAVELAVEGNEDRLWITPSLHLGKGFETTLGPAWMDTTLSVDLFPDGSPTVYTGFALIGVRPLDRLMTMVGVEAMRSAGETQLKLMPSVAWEIGEGRHVTGGYTHVLEGSAPDELSLGIWLNF